MTATTEKQEYTFQAEIKQLLHLLSHSLYQNREITIRELVSNASDALDKMRHVQLTSERYRDDKPLEIRLAPHKDERRLEIVDTGVGMTREELVSNLGTIAHSGSLEFLNRLSGDAKADLSLIGQFGVGFYSAFMLADRVEVLTRSYLEESGWRWESDGTGRYGIEPADGLERGTTVRLHLKDGQEEFTEPHRLRHIVRKYSTFIPHAIRLDGEQLNEQRPIWVEPKSQVTAEQYAGFYQHLTHRVDETPLWHLHLSLDSPIQFHALLYCPPANFELMGFGRIEHGLHLCAKRILVQDDCRELLPEYLRFLHGLVDSADLPLNVSRQALQDDTVFRKIRKVLVKKVLDHLDATAAEQPAEYLTFYRQFGVILREGIGTDFENRERVARLLRFRSTRADGEDRFTSLDEYLERAPEGQTQIYFLGGPDPAALRKNPNLEIFRKQNLEVLFLTDPVDEFVLAHLGSYKDKPLRSIDAADVDLPETGGDEASPDAEKPAETPSAGFAKVLELFREALGDRVAEVRESKRLTDSPCCLVNPSGGMSMPMQKMLQMTSRDFTMAKPLFEVNPSAALIRRLGDLSANADHHEFIRECGRQLCDNALLLEGLPPSPEDAVARSQRFMDELAAKRSPLVL